MTQFIMTGQLQKYQIHLKTELRLISETSSRGFMYCRVSPSSSWQLLHELQQDEDSSTGGTGIILQR